MCVSSFCAISLSNFLINAHLHMHTHHPVYRASFPETFGEIKKGRGDYKTALPVLFVMLGFSVWLAGFLRKTSKEAK